MTKDIKYLLIIFLASLPLLWEISLLKKASGDYLFWTQTENFYLANGININRHTNNLKRIKKPEIKAIAAISIKINKFKKRILFQKNKDKKLPIASLSKLMTTAVVLESNYDFNKVITINQKSIDQEGDSGHLEIGEKIRVKNLLKLALIVSSNDAAYALASEYSGMKLGNFINLMNITAKEMGLRNTHFVNPTGLDPDNQNDCPNYSTAEDLAKLAEFFLNKPKITNILSTSKTDFYSVSGIHHKLKNTDEILQENLSWSNLIVGGKTGWTPMAKGCLILILKNIKSDGYIINVILGSDNRFGDMKKLINWELDNYK